MQWFDCVRPTKRLSVCTDDPLLDVQVLVYSRYGPPFLSALLSSLPTPNRKLFGQWFVAAIPILAFANCGLWQREQVVVPFLIGFLGVLGYCYDLDPILILFFMRSETVWLVSEIQTILML